jgi:capsular polysaccharide biosynthesis protein
MFNYLRMFRKGFYLIIIPPLLLGLLAFAVTKQWILPSYEAGTSVVVENKVTDNSRPYEDILASQALAKSFIIIAQSAEIRQNVASNLAEDSINAEALLKKTQLELANDTNIISITVKDSNPMRVAKIADIYADVLVKRVPEYMKNVNVLILDHAMVPEKAKGPQLLLNVAVGMMLGLMLGLISAYIGEFTRESRP